MRMIPLMLLALVAPWPLHAQPATPSHLEVQRAGSTPAQKGSAETFTGDVWINAPFRGHGASRVSGSHVSFAPGARTAWHTHPVGQTLVVTHGCGLAQSEGAPVQPIRAGDTVWIPPGVRHWHGATPTSGMSHVAVVESLDGSRVQWMEHVTDAQYAAGARLAPCATPAA